MRISINADERAIAQTALDLGDKQCDQVRKGLEALHVEDLAVMALQGRVGELRRALGDTKSRIYEWGFDDRRALAICLRIYRDKLNGLVKSEAKLFVENASTEDKIGDIGDFLARLAGQESLFMERETVVENATRVSAEPARADAAPTQEEMDLGEQLPAGIVELNAERDVDSHRWTPTDHRSWLADLAGELERGASRLKYASFMHLAQRVLPSVAALWDANGFDGTRAGGFLFQEVVHDEVNAIALASWIRGQLRDAPDGFLSAAPEQDPPPPKLSREAVNDIRQSLGKDPLEPSPEEQRVLAENSVRNPLEVPCHACGAHEGEPCTASGKIVGAGPHVQRLKLAGAKGAAARQVADALYLDAVAQRVFGRVDDEIREAIAKRRTFDGKAKWVATLLASAPAGGAHASA